MGDASCAVAAILRREASAMRVGDLATEGTPMPVLCEGAKQRENDAASASSSCERTAHVLRVTDQREPVS
jgi:hypothetical protein